MKRPGTNTTAVTGRTKPRAVEDRTDTWALNGTTFDPDKAALLQRTLRADPHNLEARVKLLGYLSQRRFGNLKDPNYCEHAVWLIRNYPGIKVSGSPWVAVHRRIDPCFRKIERIWDHHRVHFPRDSAVLRNVARFYSGTGSLRKAEAVLRRLQGLEPHNPDWHGDLARLYYLHGRWQKPAERRYWASKALHEYIRAEAKSSAKQRYYLLPDLAEAAYEAGGSQWRRGMHATCWLALANTLERGVTGTLSTTAIPCWASLLRTKVGLRLRNGIWLPHVAA